MPQNPKVHRLFLDNPEKSFNFLLVAILLMYVVRPFLEGTFRANFLMEVFFVVVLASGLYALRGKTRTMVIALFLGLPAILSFGIFHAYNHPHLWTTGLVFGVLFLLFTILIIVAYLFMEREVNTDVIVGAVCAYFLIGTAWAMGYTLLEHLNPGSFKFPDGFAPGLSTFHYFSFTTLTTLGYGDITPLTHKALSLSTLEAITGQLYVATLVARLVGMRTSHSSSHHQ
jgi:hypothetical protein